MDIRYIGSGEPDDAPVCDVFGLTFPLNEWVEVPTDAAPAVVSKLSANPTFEARDVRPAPAVDPADKSKRGRPPKASA